jgi:hypothetical protein
MRIDRTARNEVDLTIQLTARFAASFTDARAIELVEHHF